MGFDLVKKKYIYIAVATLTVTLRYNIVFEITGSPFYDVFLLLFNKLADNKITIM